MAHQHQELLRLGVLHGCTTASEGDMKDAAARNAFLERQGVNHGRMLYLRQTHSENIIRVENAAKSDALLAQPAPEADAWILKASNCGSAVFTADCAPVLLWDSKAEIFGVVHAGWRGAAKLLAAKTAAQMLELGAQKPLGAFIGPRIQPCCFEVGEELLAQFPPAAFSRRDKRLFLDLGHALRLQLEQAGLTRENITLHTDCTCCGKDYFSYRRNKGTGRLMTYIFKK